jgi:hypothetical protein
MEIDKMFINDSNILKEKVANLPMENCIDNYFNYLDSRSEGLEQKYIIKLNDRAKSFIAKIELKAIKDKNIDEIKKMYIDIIWDGFYGMCEKPWSDVADEYSYSHSCKDMYKDIKKEMTEALEELLTELNTSEKEKNIAQLKKSLEFKKNALSNIDQETEFRKTQLANEINKLEQELESLQ